MSSSCPASPRKSLLRGVGVLLVSAGCFHDTAPSFPCAGPFAACPAEMMTTSAMGESSTGGPVDNSRHFRIDTLAIVDPHLFLGKPCVDGTELLNANGIASQIAAGDFNLLLSFKDFELDSLEPTLSEAVSCDLMAMTCVVTPSISVSAAALRIDQGSCNTLDPVVMSMMSFERLFTPQPTCFRTAPAKLALPIQDATLPIILIDAQLVFNLDPLADANAITNGLLYGFFTRASAEATTLSILGLMIDVWSLITGISDPDCVANHGDLLPSTEIYKDTEGVWMAANFTATRVQVIAAP